MADTRSNICQPSIAGHHRDCPDDDECMCERLYELDAAIKDSETLDEAYALFYDPNFGVRDTVNEELY